MGRFPIFEYSFRRFIWLREGAKISTRHHQRNDSATNDWGPVVLRAKKQGKSAQIRNIQENQIDWSLGHDLTDASVLIRYRISKYVLQIVDHEVHASQILFIR